MGPRFHHAVHTCCVLALAGAQRVTSAMLAPVIGANPATVREIAAVLVRAGLLRTTPGRHGGIALAVPADDITLAAVFDAVTETTDLLGARAFHPNPSCEAGQRVAATLDRLAQQATTRLRAQLATMTIADVLAQSVPPSAKPPRRARARPTRG